MATHLDDFSMRPNRPTGRPVADDVGTMLERLSSQIQAQIIEVEHKHAEALQAMQSKLERMAGTAERARPQMPSDLAAAFSRIEAGMTDLVDRIAETVPEPRREHEFVFAGSKPLSNHFVFDPPKRQPAAPMALDNTDTTAAEPWDRASAEALARLYESGEAALAKHLPEAALFAAGRSVAKPAETAPKPACQAAGRDAARVTQVTAPVVVAGLGDDRSWLDNKLSAIAAEVTQSIGATQSDGALKTLMARVDQFETRFATALDGLASKADMAGMRTDVVKQIESQIVELAGAIDQTHQQLTRLDAIEHQLTDLTAFAHASMDQSGRSEVAADAAPQHDLEHLADLAVERALSRFPQPQATGIEPVETNARVEAVHSLLEEIAAERRRGDEYTTGMLETVQEALIRLIDRVDAIDAANGRAPSEGVAPHHEPHSTSVHSSPVVQSSAPIAVAPSAPQLAPARVEEVAETEQASQPRRRVRITPAVEPSQTDADAVAALAADDPNAQPEINIKDLKVNPRNVRAGAPVASADANVAADEGEVPPKARKARPASNKQVASNTARRGLYVAAAALSLVGIGFMAQNLLTSRDAGPVPAAPASAAPVKAPVAAQPTVGTTAVPSTAARPGVPQTTPPGMLPIVPKPNQAPAAQQPPPSPDQRSEAAPLAPASVPETVSDDLSLNDTIEDGQATPAPALTANQPMTAPIPTTRVQGMALAGSAPLTGQQLMDIDSLNRQSVQALTSERVGYNARPASDFSNRFGLATPTSPAAKTEAAPPAAPATAAIVTGSTSATEAIPEPAGMPPALVGPLSLRMAAARGDASASFEVATRFAEGRGIKQDFKQAITWYQRAANKGLAIAQYRLGTLYERGLGTPPDAAKARVWYKKAADQGNVKAMHNMAVLSAGNGQGAPDYVTAAKWFKDAADRGLSDSQFNLAVLYENGLGVGKDPKQAYVWFSLAARNGDQEATRRRDQILATLDAETLAAANADVQKWHARPTDQKINDPRVAGDQWRVAAAQAPELPAMPAPVDAAQDAAPTGGPRTIKVPSVPR